MLEWFLLRSCGTFLGLSMGFLCFPNICFFSGVAFVPLATLPLAPHGVFLSKSELCLTKQNLWVFCRFGG